MLLAHGRSRVLPAPVRPVCHRSACLAIVVDELVLLMQLIGSIASACGWLVIGAVLQHCPRHARGLIGHRDYRDVRMATRGQTGCPLTEAVVFVFGI